MERATGTEVYGCGSPQTTDITLNIQTTTGGSFTISLSVKNTVEYLKKLVSKKLKVSKDRICLLHRERQLREGTLEENGLRDGARVVLLPSVETGLLSQRPENSVMQALESLNETQVNDFLSGKSPLNLTMRLGDHMMLIQLQLSTLSAARALRGQGASKAAAAPPLRFSKQEPETSTPQTTPEKTTSSDSEPSTSTSSATPPKKERMFLKQDLEMLKNAFDIYRNMTEDTDKDASASLDIDKEELLDTSNCTVSDLSDTSVENDQSPIKSLSNLVSSPLDATTSETKESIANSVRTSLIDLLSNKMNSEHKTPIKSSKKPSQPPVSSLTPDSSLSDDGESFTDQSSFLAESTIDEYPMENLFNSAVDKGLFEEQDESMMDREISNLATMSHGTQESTASGALPSFQSINEPLKTKRFQYLLHKTSKFKHPIGQNKQKAFMQSVVNKHKKKMQIRQDTTQAQPSTSRTEPYFINPRKLILQPSGAAGDPAPSTSTAKETFRTPDTPRRYRVPPRHVEAKDIIEASKNLTQKLKKLSKEVLTNKIDLRNTEEPAVRTKVGPGAVIESMKHHGKGIYSGTFSGTLNPALQDRYGRPKRDISTIIHILNDLLCATPPIALSQKETKEEAKCGGCSQAACGGGCEPCAACAGRDAACKQCDTAKTLALENNKTKCKLEQLRLVMQQKKQRREARKMKTMPYPSPAKLATDNPAGIQDEIDTAA